MTQDIESTLLFKYIADINTNLACRLIQIRTSLSKLLPYIIQLYPHFPSHGIDHSDRIIAQLSKMLFHNDSPVVQFSATEVYCLVCATYLHDMGMVVSPGEMITILNSKGWENFISADGAGHDDYHRIEQMRSKPFKGTEDEKHFVTDTALHHLVADYVRRTHHKRCKTALESHNLIKLLICDNDTLPIRTIIAIAEGHGLSESELADRSRYPTECDVLGEKVNVLFLARLLRIGDLLDVDNERANPFAATAVSPLPYESEQHWLQYSDKILENITPDTISFVFECKNQEVHRLLRDSLGQLEKEIQNTSFDQARSKRHGGWRPPHCSVANKESGPQVSGSLQPTIIIKPAEGVNYTFHDWRLELDHERVLERLIHDVYAHPLVFIRELIQNSLDATRCQMYADYHEINPSASPPARPTQFPEEFRDSYPIIIRLSEEEVTSSPDGEIEKRKVFTIEDRGIGMNEHVITNYFLQVGRTYYRSNEFREKYSFSPTSRFGVGFLSVFAVSNDITVETAKKNDSTGIVEGLKLRLFEPRNYLLTEKWAPFEDRVSGPHIGTRIRVVLDSLDWEETLDSIIRRWCVAVEVPILISDLGRETFIISERLVENRILAHSNVNPIGRFLLRTFDVNTQDVEGQISVIAYEDENGEGWCDCWPRKEGLDGERLDKLPACGEGFVSVHGIYAGRPHGLFSSSNDQWVQRVDFRSDVNLVTVDRTRVIKPNRFAIKRRGVEFDRGFATAIASGAVQETAAAVVEEHLRASQRSKGAAGLYYVGSVLTNAPVDDDWRDNYPNTVVTWLNNERRDISVSELFSLDSLVLNFSADFEFPRTLFESGYLTFSLPADFDNSQLPIISLADCPVFSRERFVRKISSMNLVGITNDNLQWYLAFSNVNNCPNMERVEEGNPSWVAPLNLGSYDGIYVSSLDRYNNAFLVLDSHSVIVKWLDSLRNAVSRGSTKIKSEEVVATRLLVVNEPFSLPKTVARWATDYRVPPELKPPLGQEYPHLIYVKAQKTVNEARQLY